MSAIYSYPSAVLRGKQIQLKLHNVKGNGKVFITHSMQAYGGSGGSVPLNLNLRNSLMPLQLTPGGKKRPMVTKRQPGWAPETIQKFYRPEYFLPMSVFETPRFVHPVTYSLYRPSSLGPADTTNCMEFFVRAGL